MKKRNNRQEHARISLTWEQWGVIWEGLAVVIALCFSIGSCMQGNRTIQIAQEANRSATEANTLAKKVSENTQESFSISNRPYITLNPVEFKSGGFLQVSRDDMGIVIKMQFLMRNVGNTPATNLALPKGFIISASGKPQGNVKIEIPPAITLSPEEEKYIIVAVAGTGSDRVLKDEIRHFKDGKAGVTTRVVLNYSGLGTPGEYKTMVVYRVDMKNARMLLQEAK